MVITLRCLPKLGSEPLLLIEKPIHVLFENRVVTAKAIGRQLLRADFLLNVPRAHSHVSGSIRDAESPRHNRRRSVPLSRWSFF
jgi:hypothetical protein